MPDDFPPLLLDDDDVQNDPDLAWYSDKGSGGYHLPFGTHTGRTVNEVPESYLVWAKTHLKGRYGVHRSVTRTLGAIEAFVEGLEGCLDEWFDDFIVPCGVHHRGKTIRRCSDRAWLSWVVGRDRVRRSCPLFVKAVYIWLGSKTRLKAAVDPTTFLPPARYHADLREGQSMPREGDVTDDGVESNRPTPTHADLDASITDLEDEEDHPSQHSPSPAYRLHSRGSSSNYDRVDFVVADDRVSVSTDDSAYGELERAESLLRSSQKKRRRSSNDDLDERLSKRRARHRHRVESTSSSRASSPTHGPTHNRRASSSSPSAPRSRRRPSTADDDSPIHYTRSQARIAQEPESPGPRTRAQALAASQARGVAAVSTSRGATTSASGVAGASVSATNHASWSARSPASRSATGHSSLSVAGRPSWSASASTAHKKPVRTYGRRTLTLSERLARLVDPPTPEPDGAGTEERSEDANADAEEEADVNVDASEEEVEEEEVEEEEEEAQEQGIAPGRDRVEDYVPDSEDEGGLRDKPAPSVEDGNHRRGARHKDDARRLVFSHVELPTRPRRPSPPPPAPAPRRSARAGKTASTSQIKDPRSSARAEGQAPSSQIHHPTPSPLVFSHVEIPPPPWRGTPFSSARNTSSVGTRSIPASAPVSIGRKRRRQSAPDELTSAEVRVTRAAARRHSPPPTASRSSSPAGAPSSRSPSRQPITSSPSHSRSTTPHAPVDRSSSISAHPVASPRKRRSVSPSRAYREQKKAKVEPDDNIPRRTRSAARLGQSASAFTASQVSGRPIPIFSLLTEDEEVEDSEGETAIMISAGVRAGRAPRSTRDAIASTSAPVAGPSSRAVHRLRSRVSSGKSSASATPSGANDPRSSATKIASSSTAVASSSFVGSRLSSAHRPSTTLADTTSDATSLRARFPNIPSSVLAARMRGVVEEVPREPTPEGEWEWYLDEFDILVKRAVVQEPPRATVSVEQFPPLFPKKNEPLAALALLADVLRPFGSHDRDSGCTYVLGGRWDFDRPELLRSEANERTEYLSKAISDLQTAGDGLTKQTRWRAQYVPLTEIYDDRLVLERMRAAIARGLQVCKDVPVFWGLAYWAITFRLGFTGYREQIASFPYRTFALVTLVLLCLYFTFITHATNRSTSRVRYELERVRKQSHRWILAWKALQGVASKMLDGERMYESRGQHIIHILAQMDHLIECPYGNSTASKEPTVLDSLDANTIHLPGRHALARDMVARIRPVIEGERRGSGSMGHASSFGPQSFDDAETARLDNMITAACNELSIRDALFRFSVRSRYGLLRTRPLLVNRIRPQPLKGAVDKLVQALKDFPLPQFFQATHQPCVACVLLSLDAAAPPTRAAGRSSRFLRGDGLVDGLFGATYVWIVRTHLEPISLCALKGLQDYGCSYRDHVGVQNVREAAARVELYANYHLVHLKLLQKITTALLHPRDPEDSAALDDLVRILATLNNSNASSTTSISAALEFALNKRSERPLEVGPYAHADVVRRLIDGHYPFFQREMGPRGRKRGRRGQADGDEDSILLLDEFEFMGVEGPLRQRFRIRVNLGDASTTWA
ncbi:hypothetical protein GGF50DRAFT_66566 [Schizophyllum commune]